MLSFKNSEEFAQRGNNQLVSRFLQIEIPTFLVLVLLVSLVADSAFHD